jgi:hypothetical protein
VYVSLCALAVVSAAAPDWDRAGKAWWKHVEFLASDKLEGRNVGSAGYEKAADYMAEQFEKAGLQAGGNGSYFQTVTLTETALNSSAISLVRDGKSVPVAVPGEVHPGYSPTSVAELEAPVVFAGYGLVIPEANYNDLSGLDVKGKIVAFLTGGPENIAGNLRSHYSSADERWKALRAAGAIGILSIANPKSMEIPWARQSLAWGMPRMQLSDASMSGMEGLQFSASWDPAQANDLLGGSSYSFEEILEAANANKPLPHFNLACRLKATVSISNRQITSKNVIAIRPGTDPVLKNEFVAISAHLDHLGTGKPVKGDAIYNGAMDDASGDASLIEIAKALQDGKISTRRSIVFISVTGEEKGELGSKYFAQAPTLKGKIVADLNMDMFLPLFPLKWLEVQGLNESTLGSDIRAVAESAGVKVQADKEPNRNRFIRSDQYSFVKKGVPALAFKFGYLPGDPEEKIFKDWYTNRYHGVSDDIDQPVDLAAAAQFNAILKQLAVRVADATKAPEWLPDSFFKRFSQAGTE